MWRSLPGSAGICRHCACRRPAQLVLLTARRRVSSRSSTPRESAKPRQKLSWLMRTSIEEDVATAPGDGAVVAQPQAAQGEDAAAFDPGQQSAGKWAFFTAELVAVLGIMYAVRLQLRSRGPCLLLSSALAKLTFEIKGAAPRIALR